MGAYLQNPCGEIPLHRCEICGGGGSYATPPCLRCGGEHRVCLGCHFRWGIEFPKDPPPPGQWPPLPPEVCPASDEFRAAAAVMEGLP